MLNIIFQHILGVLAFMAKGQLLAECIKETVFSVSKKAPTSLVYILSIFLVLLFNYRDILLFQSSTQENMCCLEIPLFSLFGYIPVCTYCTYHVISTVIITFIITNAISGLQPIRSLATLIPHRCQKILKNNFDGS